MNKKRMTTILAIVLVLAIAVGGTIAYLTSTTKTAVNTFTVGAVKIKLTEAPVDPTTHKIVEGGDRIEGTQEGKDYTNTYALVMPGDKLDKDPMVTVLHDSAECYVRAIMTVELSAEGIEAAKEAMKVEGETDKVLAALGSMTDLTKTFEGLDTTTWIPKFVNGEAVTSFDPTEVAKALVKSTDGKITFEVWYKDAVPATVDKDRDLAKLFTAVNIPTALDEYTLPIFQNLKVSVVAHAIQRTNLDTAEEAWAAFKTQNEPATTPAP